MSSQAGPSQGLPPHKPKCLYEILGISKDASVQDIRVAYKREAKKWHPDRCKEKGPNGVEISKQKFQLISEAYAVLTDPKKREKYDRGELDHNKEPIDVDEFLAELRTLMLMHGKRFPEGLDASMVHNVPGTNVPDFNEIRMKLFEANDSFREPPEAEAMQEDAPITGGHPEMHCDQLEAFMADAVEVLGTNWFRCTLCTGPKSSVVVYPCQKMMRAHFEREHACEFLGFLEEYFPEESGTDPCEEFKKVLEGMNVSENDWKACQMIDQSARQALPSHRPNGFTHGTHGPGRNEQVPYSLSFTDLAASACPSLCSISSRSRPKKRTRARAHLCAYPSLPPPLQQGYDSAPAVPLMQRTFTMQRSMPNPPTDPLCPDWFGQVLEQAGAMSPWETATSSSSSSSSFYPSPEMAGGFPGGFPAVPFDGGNAPGGRPPAGKSTSKGKSTCRLPRVWGKR